MEKPTKYNELIYMRNRENGEHLYDGIPCPSIEVHDLIGDEGVEVIRQKLNQMLEWRKTMYQSNYGFTGLEQFVDLKTKTIFAVGSVIGTEVDNWKENIREDYPELVVSDKYKKNNYELLRNKNHYLIELYDEFTKYHSNLYLPEKYRFY